VQSLSTSLEENKAYFQGRFAHSMDFITREFTLAGRKAALFAVDGLINKEIIALSVMEPLLKTQDYPPAPQAMLAHIERAVLSAAELKHERDLEKLLMLLMSGFVLLCIDGCDDGLVSGVQGFAYRGPQEPQNEVMQRGAKDGFTESNQLNMAMIRRRMKNPALKFQPLEVGSHSSKPSASVSCFMLAKAYDISRMFDTSDPLTPPWKNTFKLRSAVPYSRYDISVRLLAVQPPVVVVKYCSLPSFLKKFAMEVALGISIPPPSKSTSSV